jgi:hypothetical protein
VGRRERRHADVENIFHRRKPAAICRLTARTLIPPLPTFLDTPIHSIKPVYFVFHGGSGSEKPKITESLDYGVIKMVREAVEDGEIMPQRVVPEQNRTHSFHISLSAEH